MKGAFSISFAIFYLVLSVGMNLDVHYCGDKLMSVEIIGEQDKCCASQTTCCSKESTDCCNDENVFVHFDEWQISNTTNPSTLSSTKAITVDFVSRSVKSTDQTFKRLVDHPPPKCVPLWLLYGALTFYG